MRLVACALSAVLLSGCSWLGMGGGSHGQHQSYEGKHSGRYVQQSGQYTHNAYKPQMGPCQISSPMQAIPQGCRPEQVTLAIGGTQHGGQYAGGQYANAGYGSHAGQAAANTQYHTPKKRLKRPLLRGSLGLEIDHSVAGNLFDPGASGSAALYDRLAVQEGSSTIVGTNRVDTVYTSVPEEVVGPTISFDDVYTAPLRITGGLELIMSDHATLFANAGFTRAEGKRGGGVSIVDELQQQVTTTPVDATGAPIGPGVTNIGFIPNVEVATFNTEFNELEKYDFEVGGRYYMDPILTSQLNRTLTPFVAASGGAAHYNDTTVVESQSQLFLGRAYDSGLADTTFYNVPTGSVSTQLYDAQWVPYGQLKAGMEWQMTPKTALAFEAGVKYEGARDFSDGTPGDDIISIPVAIRGSYNF